MIGNAYLNEIRPHLQRPIDYERLFRLIPRNMLTKDQVDSISKSYNQEVNGGAVTPGSSDYVQVFSSLYRAGLLGYVARDTGTMQPIQKFERAGNLPLIDDTMLPPLGRPTYSIRCSMPSSGCCPPTTTTASTHSTSPGPTAPGAMKPAARVCWWRTWSGYTRIMSDPALAHVFQRDITRILDECCTLIDRYEVARGDSLILIDRNPVNLRDAAMQIAGRLRASDYSALLRVGADFGVLVEPVVGTGDLVGMPLRTAARLEPHAKDDTLAMTAEFFHAIREIDPGFECDEITGRLGDLRRDGGLFDLRKSPSDPETWRKLYFMSLQS